MAITLSGAHQPVTRDEEEPQPDTKTSLERIAESVTDGRAENVRYRQEELFSLHAALVEHASIICRALGTVPSTESDERRDEAVRGAEVEYYLALDAVRHFYDSLDFERELEDEYAVTNGRDYEKRRVGYGMVVIRPTGHTRFYSVFVTLAAALSAGNCVVVELPKPNDGDENFEIDTLLRALLRKSLDASIFCFADNITKDFSKSDLEAPFTLVVDQRNDERLDMSDRNLLISANDAITLAVIDRTADVDEAVRLIAQAKRSVAGKSPYTPDLVLVNEFVKEAAVEAFSRFPGIEVKLHEGKERRSLLANIKSAEASKVLNIATCYSLVDVISTIGPGAELLAGYFFAEPRAAKYLSQHLPCAVSYINQIPTHLLVGPAAPRTTTTQPDLLYRYSKDMFSKPRPQLIEPPPESFRIVDEYLALEGEPLSSLNETEEGLPNGTTEKAISVSKRRRRKQELRTLATGPLKPVLRPNNADFGFFESAFLLAAGLVIVPVLGWGSFVVGRRLLGSR